MKNQLLYLLCLVVILLCAVPALADSGQTIKSKDNPGPAVVAKNRDSRKRIALVIGNSKYHSSHLKNPVNDANAVAASLKRLGFEVEMRTNLGRAQLEEAIENFGNRLGAGGVGLFYYAGHGIQVAGNNYLVPIDAKIKSEGEVRHKAVDVGLILAKMGQAKSDVNIVIMDACRDNPFGRSFRSAAKGLATMDAPNGAIIAYAAAPGKTAADDGDGANGLYTSELLKVLETPGLNLEGVFKQVKKSVLASTSGQQTPWESSGLTSDFRFIPSPDLTDIKTQALPAPESTMNSPKATGSLDNIRARTEAEETAKKERLVQVKNDLAKYEKVVSSPRGAELQQVAWRALIANYAEAATVPLYDTAAFLSSLGLAISNGDVVTVDEAELAKKKEAARLAEERAKSVAGEFVNVPGGCFATNGKQVCLDAFRIGKYDVTQGQYKQVMGSNPSSFSSCGDGCPVENVSWNDAQAFISRLKSQAGKQYRLPTEAEWEYACHSGGKIEEYCGGDNIDAVAWYFGNSGGKTHPVGQKQPNGLGIYDMSGNVWQWVQDWYGILYPTSGNNPHGASSGSSRVFRGGSWRHLPAFVKSTYRYYFAPGFLSSYIGFRLVSPVE